MKPIDFTGKLILAPRNERDWEAWRNELHAWRERSRLELDYTGELYARPEFAWTHSCFTCCMVMLFDQEFYDPHAGCYRVDAFLDDGERKFGGFDAVVLWHAYPRIGFDDRNQFDFYRQAPGGLDGLREVCRTCHARGVKVFLDYNPWDAGTRREDRPDLEILVGLVQAIEADGVFLDTLKQGSAGFLAALNAERPGVALESEGMTPLDRTQDHHLSWGQWAADSLAPGVLRNKWFERRHMVHMIARWDRERSAALQTAWMNGAGVLIWENVFGSWNGWNEHDRWLLRSLLPVQRRYTSLFTEGEWQPLTGKSGAVYASSWESGGLRLWTLINRSRRRQPGSLFLEKIEVGARYFDLMRGIEIELKRERRNMLKVMLPGLGCGAILACSRDRVDPAFLDFLDGQATTWAQANFSRKFPQRRSRRRRPQKTARQQFDLLAAGVQPVEGGRYTVLQSYRHRECGMYAEPMYVDVWKPGPPDFHGDRFCSQTIALGPFAIDIRDVTNGEYYRFLQDSGYQPGHTENFLKHWLEGAPPPGTEDEPVVYVDLDDARAYARWAGKRLPTEYEWQIGMQHTREPAGPRVWNWTESEHSDGRTRFCILKGGSDYCAIGSQWYADGGPREPGFAAKFILFWPGLDRCATLGFRCVVDLQ